MKYLTPKRKKCKGKINRCIEAIKIFLTIYYSSISIVVFHSSTLKLKQTHVHKVYFHNITRYIFLYAIKKNNMMVVLTSTYHCNLKIQLFMVLKRKKLIYEIISL